MEPTRLLVVAVVAAGTLASGAPVGSMVDPQPESSPAAEASLPPFDRPVRAAATDYNITVVGGELPFDPNLTFARVEALVDRNATPPDTIVIRSINETAGDPPNRFRRLLGFDRRDWDSAYAETGGSAASNVTVYVAERSLDDPVRAESSTAHEFVHIIQFQMDATLTPADPTVDSAKAHRAVVEGVADSLQRTYWRRYLNEGESPSARTEKRYARGAVEDRWFLSSYLYGTAYVEARADDPEAVLDLTTALPSTTEAVLHPARGEESLPPLRVRSETRTWNERDRTRMGELFVRVVLSGALNRSAAAAAADGWANDRRITYGNGSGTPGYVWVLRWETAAEADEFLGTFERYLDRRATATEGRWRSDEGYYRLERPGQRTTVVVLGTRSAVAGTTVTAREDGVAVSGPDVTPTPSPTPASSPTASPSATASPTETTPGGPGRSATSGGTDATDTASPGVGPVAGLVALTAAALVLGRQY